MALIQWTIDRGDFGFDAIQRVHLDMSLFI
jgi:hypothetical protein